ncbi:hypothetical protein B0H11DRAFT_2310350 [Mycena galericulata]|nr:hypothetical protein B0H11DRAFT_2310350 [Mycena galericulata]
MHYKQHRTLVVLGKRFAGDWEHCVWWESRASSRKDQYSPLSSPNKPSQPGPSKAKCKVDDWENKPDGGSDSASDSSIEFVPKKKMKTSKSSDSHDSDSDEDDSVEMSFYLCVETPAPPVLAVRKGSAKPPPPKTTELGPYQFNSSINYSDFTRIIANGCQTKTANLDVSSMKWKFDRPANATRKPVFNSTAFDVMIKSLKDRKKDYVFSVYMSPPTLVKKELPWLKDENAAGPPPDFEYDLNDAAPNSVKSIREQIASIDTASNQELNELLETYPIDNNPLFPGKRIFHNETGYFDLTDIKLPASLADILGGYFMGSGIPCPTFFEEVKGHFPDSIDLSLADTPNFRAQMWTWAVSGSPFLAQDAGDISIVLVDDRDILYLGGKPESLRPSLLEAETCRSYAENIPNQFRAIDNGEDLFTVWVPVWADDVSGARSKQYQKHLNVYTANANLPGQLLQQEYFVRFVCTSPHAGALEQWKVVVDQVKSTHKKPVRTYDAATLRPCGFRLNVPDGPADNPQQAEEASHIGHQGNHFCRRCHVGGTIEDKECPDGYHSFYETGRPRNVDDIRNCVLEQLRLATYGVAARVEALQTVTGTKDKIAQHWIEILILKAREMQTASPGRLVDDISNELLIWLRNETDQPYNPLLDLPFFDPSQDTLVEIIHTILLGDAKYTWYELHHNWTAVQQDIFTVRLQSTNLDGLTVPPIRAAYMMQYRNGLIGKHFKTLMQTKIFHIHDIVTPDQFTLVRALGELGPHLWTSFIDDMDTYPADLQILIDNLLDAFATLDPTKILIKLKLHVLLHIVQDIRRRGPAVRFSTEVFECFNAIFRLCSVLSNHQAPSRDIAAKFADLDRVKHILSGGYWLQDTEWLRAGKDVQRILHNTPIIQKHLGWAPPPFWTPGLIQSVAQKKQSKLQALTATETMLLGATTVTGDRCTVGSWALFRLNEVPMIARISIILLPKGSKPAQGMLVVSKYHVAEALHPHFHMPVLLPDTAASSVIVPSNSVQFIFNVQHDCRACGCDASGVTRQMQERQESDTIIHSVVHKDDTRFVINMHGFHNARLLRKFLPISLTKPRPLFPDRRKRHDELAGILAITEKAKRAATQEKAAATREKNKAAKEARTEAGDGARDIEDEAGRHKRPRNSFK